MAVSLARRIRRIGLLPSTKDEKGFRVRNVDPTITEDEKKFLAAKLRNDAALARRIFKDKLRSKQRV